MRARPFVAGSINSVCFAPAELGLIFAAASSDGIISVHTCDESTGLWSVAMVQNDGGLPAHPLGATCASFSPAMEAGALTSARTSKVSSHTGVP
jgi:protein transport protein SEC13